MSHAPSEPVSGICSFLSSISTTFIATVTVIFAILLLRHYSLQCSSSQSVHAKKSPPVKKRQIESASERKIAAEDLEGLNLRPRTPKRPSPINSVLAKNHKDQKQAVISDTEPTSLRCLSPNTLPVPTNTPNTLQIDTHTHTDRVFTHVSDEDMYG